MNIVLAGGGHANLEVLKGLTKVEIKANTFTLISSTKQSLYSGMIPRLIMGDLHKTKLSIDVESLAKHKEIGFKRSNIVRVDSNIKKVFLEDGSSHFFDLLSLNLGGLPKQIPTSLPSRTVYLKPFSSFLEKWEEIELTLASRDVLRFVIIGGGAAAIELAAALKVRLDLSNVKLSSVDVITAGNRLAENYRPHISASLEKALKDLGIRIHFQNHIDQINSDVLKLKTDIELPFDYVFVSTPIESTGLNVDSNLLRDKSGFIMTNINLEAARDVFAAGDCANIAGLSLSKSGVSAVHQGRHLLINIQRRLKGLELIPFIPSKRQLNILITGARSAHAIWGGMFIKGKCSFKFKNWIDDRYIKSITEIPYLKPDQRGLGL